MLRSVALLVVAFVACARQASAGTVPEPVVCEAPGSWARSQTGAWVRRFVQVAGYEVESCTGSAWVAATPAARFLVWATEPWQRPAGMRPASEPYLRGAFTDGRRVVWQAQGLAIWVEAGPGATDRLPGATAFGWLQASARGLPRRYRRLELMPTPAVALRVCRSDRALAPACPARIPRVERRNGPAGWRTYPGARPPDGIFGMQLGGEIPGRPELMRPPRILHVEVEAAPGHPRGTLFLWPDGSTTAPRDGLLHQDRSAPLLLARVTWAGRRGTVVLAPPYPAGGSQGNHVIFRWRARGTTYIVGMHAWEPFSESFAMLRRVAESLPR